MENLAATGPFVTLALRFSARGTVGVRTTRHQPRGDRLGLRRLLDSVAAALLLALVAAGTPAQLAGAASEEPATDQAAKPQPIPVGEVPERAQTVEALLAAMRQRAETNSDIQKIETALPELGSLIRGRAERDEPRLDGNTTLSDVMNVQKDWNRDTGLLESSRNRLSERTSRLARDIEELSQLRLGWQATREHAVATEVSGVLLEQIDATLKSIGQTRRIVDERLARLASLSEEVTQLDTIVKRVRKEAAAARARLREQLFTLDSPPLWSEEFESDIPLTEAMWTQLRARVEQTRDYFEDRIGALTSFVILTILLMVLLSALNAPAQQRAEEDASFAPAAAILARPISAGLLVSLLIGFLAAFSTAPQLLTSVIGLILIVPILRLLPRAILPNLAWTLYCVTGWYIVLCIRKLLLIDLAITRAILMFEALAVLALLFWLIRPARLSQLDQPSRALRAIGIAIRAAIPILAAAVVANLLGNVSLAYLLTDAVLIALYLGFLLYAAETVLEAAYGVSPRTRAARSLRMVRRHEALLLERGKRLIRIATSFLWLVLTAEAFGVREPIVDAVWSFLSAQVQLGDIAISLGDFVLFGLMIWLAQLLSRLVRFVLEEDILPRARLPRGVPFAISAFARYAILLIGFMMAVAAIGFDLSRFALIVGALGVGIGIGLQDVVNNFVSGAILLFERPIQLGDTVEVGDLRGDVTRIGMRSSTVRTFDGAEVIVPNSQFISVQFVNWTLSDRQRRLSLPVGVAYGTDPERVIGILVEVAAADPDILDHPGLQALFLGFGESSLDFELRAWTGRFESWRQVQSNLAVAIHRALKEAGIEIPFPQRDLHLRSVSPEARGPATEDAEPRDGVE